MKAIAKFLTQAIVMGGAVAIFQTFYRGERMAIGPMMRRWIRRAVDKIFRKDPKPRKKARPVPQVPAPEEPRRRGGFHHDIPGGEE